jgi:hypothetical protein
MFASAAKTAEPRLRRRSEAVEDRARGLELLLGPEHVTVRQRFQPVRRRERCIGFLRFPECLRRILVLEAVQQRDPALKCRLRRVVAGVLEMHGSERVGMRCFLIGLPCDGRRGQTGNQRENSEFHKGPSRHCSHLVSGASRRGEISWVCPGLMRQ